MKGGRLAGTGCLVEGQEMNNEKRPAFCGAPA